MSEYPSVGRIVHYSSYGTPLLADGTRAYASECRAAIVTKFNPAYTDYIGIAIMNPTGMFFNEHVRHDQDAIDAGTWHWPECDDAS